MSEQGTERTIVSDDELHAYADCALDPVRYAQVQAYLHRDPEDAAKVAAYAMQNAGLRSLYEAGGNAIADLRIASLAVQLERKFRAQRRFGRVARLAAASVLLVSVGWAGWSVLGFVQPGERPGQDFARQAAAAHRLFAVGAIGAAPDGTADRSTVVSWLSQRVAGVPLQAPDLTAAGYRLVRDRVVPSQTNPAALLVYEHQSGDHPLTLYIGKRAGTLKSSTVYSQNNDVSMVYWQVGPLAYSLVGRIDRKTLLRLAGDVGAQVRAQPPLPERFVQHSPESNPRKIRTTPLRVEPAVVRPGKTDSRDAADETKSSPGGNATSVPPAKPVSADEAPQPEKT